MNTVAPYSGGGATSSPSTYAYLHAADRDLEREARSDGVDDNENPPVGFVTAFLACCSIACGGNAQKKSSMNIRLAMASFVERARVDISPRPPSAVVVPRHIEWCVTDVDPVPMLLSRTLCSLPPVADDLHFTGEASEHA